MAKTTELAFLATLAVSTPALAEPLGAQTEVELDTKVPRTYVSARIGGSTGNRGKPEVCLEVSPLSFLGVEGCGTGSGVWHHDPNPEMSHYRVKLRGFEMSMQDFWFDFAVGVGFSELQLSDDAIGFRFQDAGNRGIETAGADLSLHGRALIPIGGDFEVMSELTLGGAYFPHAEELVTPKNDFQPYFTASLGVGF